VKAEFISETSC